MQLHFINGTPEVEGDRMRVELEVNESTADLLCELLTQEKLDSPMVANCEQSGCTHMHVFVFVSDGCWSVSVCMCVCMYMCTYMHLFTQHRSNACMFG